MGGFGSRSGAGLVEVWPVKANLMRRNGTSVVALILVLASGCIEAGPRSGKNEALAPNPVSGDVESSSLTAAVNPPADPGHASGGWVLQCSASAPAPDWPQQCLRSVTATPGSKVQTWIAINPRDSQNVIAGAYDRDPKLSNKCGWSSVAVTKDGGDSWAHLPIGGSFADRPVGSPYYGWGCNSNPAFAFSADGSAHIGLELGSFGREPLVPGTSLPPKQVLLATSRDGGLTWLQVITFNPPPGNAHYGRMVVSPKTGTILEVISSEQCQLMVSRDRGATADPPVTVPWPETAWAGVCRSLSVGPDGTVVVGAKFAALVDNRHSTYFMRSRDDGRSFLDANVGFVFSPIPDPIGTMKATSFPSAQMELAYDQAGTLWLITAEAPDGDASIFIRSSKDAGRSWTSPTRVDDDETKRHQWMPNFAIAGDASFHAFFFDQRYNASAQLVDVTHAVSEDGGHTWQNQRVTTKSWDPDLGRRGVGGGVWIGNYIGVAAHGEHVWAAVPDTSLGDEPALAVAHLIRTK